MAVYKYWKYFEHRVAMLFGGQRVLDKGRAAPDVAVPTIKSPVYSLECKSMLGLPQWLKDAVLQAERNAYPGSKPIVVLGEKNGMMLVVMEARVWLAAIK